MKVLWFSNTPANSDEYLKKELSGTGGWLKSLDKSIQDKVDLHIAFYHKQNIGKFCYKNTNYYAIPQYKNFFSKVKERVLNEVIDTEDLSVYLELIEDIKPDIIHIHGTENPFGCVLYHTNIPVVTSIQGNITVYLHKFCSGLETKFLKINDTRFSDLRTLIFPYSFEKALKKFMKMQRRESKNLKFCKYIIGRTDWDRRISSVLSPKRQYFHNDEILRDNFYFVKWSPTNHQNKKIIIHTTNSNNFYKGFETICLAVNELIGLGIEFEWRVAGIANSDLIVRVIRKKFKLNFLDKNLILLGRLTEKELIVKLLEADMYVMPSHIENSPNNLCEAMILGMPCIATFAGGTGSLLKDGKEGILIQDGDPWAMVGAIIELQVNPNLAIMFGKNARKKAILRHDKDKIVKELLSIYKVIIHESIA